MLQLLLIGLAIAANNLSAAFAMGAAGLRQKRWRILFVFGITEFTIPLIGVWLGGAVARRLAGQFSWLGPALLAALGCWILLSALHPHINEEKTVRRANSWGGLIALSLGLSADNLVVGFSFGLAEFNPLVLAGTIALFSVVFSYVGLELGRRGRKYWRTATPVFSGMLLLFLATALWQGWL